MKNHTLAAFAAMLLLDLFVPDAAQHPPGAPVIEVSSVTLPDASQIVHRAEATTDPERRRTYCVSRYERRVAGRIVAREDDDLHDHPVVVDHGAVTAALGDDPSSHVLGRQSRGSRTGSAGRVT